MKEVDEQHVVQSIPRALEGANAIAEAMRQINPDVVAAYPITPQTEIVQTFSEFVADGLVDTEFVPVESEHAAMSACVGACAAGGRTQTATAGAGLALMWEVLWVAAGLRLPIVMHVVSRSLSAPLNILCDHTDSMGARDTGWIQLYAENHQEAYDDTIQSVRIAEHADVMLPVMHMVDGFIISHTMERVDILPDEAVKQFIGTYKPEHSLLDVEHPVTFGANDGSDYFFEHRRQQFDAMDKALDVIVKVGEEFGKLTGRPYGLLQPYCLEDAELALVVMGSTAGTARVVVDALRGDGVKAGLLKVRCFRPFPATAVAEALKNAETIAVMDRSECFGGQGNPVFNEVCTALFTHGQSPKVIDVVYGLGGRDTPPAHIRQVFEELQRIAGTGDTGPVRRFLGVRE
ncbi:MAG: pyruvate ferredoxin oxidoreductase [Chloroflexi bacterium]|nr:pyruvate ferredoxin oxidoreductase [Chloroflexota bacterium]